ncbi:MAG: metalloregulator ArsR/SmtB family transcription factor [bacterium]|nr:metalloregulator ArsR/SmtB family transcription factor [bacterium]
MADTDFVLAPPTVTVGFSLETVQNNLNTLMLLNQVKTRSGFGDWVERTYAQLSPERLLLNAIVLDVFWKGCEIEGFVGDFPSYIDQLARKDPEVLRQKALSHLKDKLKAEDTNVLLVDKDTYLTWLQDTVAKHWSEKGEEFPLHVFEAAFPLFQNATEMQNMIVEHLRYMWEEHLRPEWTRVLPMLQESIDAFQQVDFGGQTALQAARVVTGRNLQGIWDELDTAEKVTFVPSAHIGPYVSLFMRDRDLYVMFGARVPEGMKSRSAALSRSELLVRLNALADDTRLTILELLTERDELCAQDIITMLNLSQSSASRHLRQLTATGYLVERRRDVAKCYSLNPERINDTIRALRYFLRGRA